MERSIYEAIYGLLKLCCVWRETAMHLAKDNNNNYFFKIAFFFCDIEMFCKEILVCTTCTPLQINLPALSQSD